MTDRPSSATDWEGSGPVSAARVSPSGSEIFDVIGSDIPGNTTTPVTLSPGQSIDGEVEFNGDLDYYRVTLTAGQTYVFTLNGTGGSPLSDPYLQIYQGSTLRGFDDDAGSGLNSLLYFTA